MEHLANAMTIIISYMFDEKVIVWWGGVLIIRIIHFLARYMIPPAPSLPIMPQAQNHGEPGNNNPGNHNHGTHSRRFSNPRRRNF